ncbi:MAG: hypothetical protein WB297_03330 [Actinomycetota bacterium]
MSIYELREGYVYMRGPIEWWWGWSPVADLKAQREEEVDDVVIPSDGPWYGHRNRDVEAVVEHALRRVRADGRWEGDIAQGPYVAGLLPADDDGYMESEVMVALKQSNNGTVFVWSPQRLAHLKQRP